MGLGFFFPGNAFASVSFTVPLVMFLWIPTVLYLFSKYPARKAVVISFVVAWLYLPEAVLEIPGIPDYGKASATSYGILLATLIFDVGRFSSFRLSWIDIPMVFWCVIPLISSLTNDLGTYDGFAAILDQTVIWGVPYFLGRIYLNNLEGLRLMAMGLFIGGLSYVPLCLIENRFSPQLHRIVYGAHAGADFGQTIRLGGFRPTIFLQHGLAVGAFMLAATLAGIWLWQSKAIKQLWGYPIEWLVGSLFVTFILVRSTGAYTLIAVGLAVLLAGKFFRTALPVFLVVAGIFAYLYVNAATETFFSDQLITYLSRIFPEDRLASLQFRFDNEELLVDRAREMFWFGWGGFGRSRVMFEDGSFTVQDSLWVLAFGERGIIGLFCLFGAMLLPTLALIWLRCPPRLWFKPKIGGSIALSIAVSLYMIDCILNAMVNPLYILAAGGIAGLAMKPLEKGAADNRLTPIPRYVIRQVQPTQPAQSIQQP